MKAATCGRSNNSNIYTEGRFLHGEIIEERRESRS
jgi:hypothetical protein